MTPSGIKFNRNRMKFEGITSANVAKWRRGYPDVDVDSFIVRLEIWLENNPGRGYRNWGSFLTNNMSREQGKYGVKRRQERSFQKSIAEDHDERATVRRQHEEEKSMADAELKRLSGDELKDLYAAVCGKYKGMNRASKDSWLVKSCMYHELKTKNGKQAAMFDDG